MLIKVIQNLTLNGVEKLLTYVAKCNFLFFHMI